MSILERQFIIAGPCAMESREVMEATIAGAKALGIDTIRTNLRKPRTEPGFEGVGEEGLPWLRMAIDAGLTVALEVILPRDLLLIQQEALGNNPDARAVVWLGSRNQVHELQREIGEIVGADDRISLMVKNQPWRDERHWKGILRHVNDRTHVKPGVVPKPEVPDSRLLVCHRGFAPWEKGDYRNVADLTMARRVHESTGLPFILDPSHIGGNRALVKQLISEYGQLDWVAGQIIEVHPDPDNALTDAKQQITWEELRALLL